MCRFQLVLPIAILTVVNCHVALADDAGVEFFEKKIRPVLVEQCLKCHATDSKKLGGGLLLDHRDGIKTGGDSGSAIEPGKPEESLLIKAIRYDDESLKMPPKGKLPAAVIADFEAWVKLGAPDPRDKPALPQATDDWEETMRARANWWSLKPVKEPVVPQPQVAAWSEHPVDRFLLTKLEEQGLTPAGPADPRTLARRLSLVLTGLPPTAEQLESFVQESQVSHPNQPVAVAALEKLVDALLNSPHFGERWARHWLDVVHFTETHGNEWNYEVHHAWRYRDYLIRAFNADVPYDQLIREHIAGDLLPQPRWNEKERFNESVIGTGFYRFGEVNHDDCIGLRQIGYDLADNQIDTLTKTFQATTVACARCHNHKLDAISMQDYYALLGVIRSSRLASHGIDAPDLNALQLEKLKQLKTELRREIAAVWMQDVSQLVRDMAAAQARRSSAPNAAELAQGLEPQRLEKWVTVLADEKLPLEHFLAPWRVASVATMTDATKFPEEWKKIAEQVTRDDRERTEYNTTNFTTFADFQTDQVPDWQFAGQGFFTGTAGRSGDFTILPEGDSLVGNILPAGRFTHALSDKLNGTLRSQVLPLGKQHISFQVMGQRSSAVRLVSNNCQLNYKNYRALTSSELQWVTFSPPDDRDSLRTYAELMTMFDNPKFPDQLSALGGDSGNYRLPWEKAAENPRSYFGITRAVLHDVGGAPKPEISHQRRLFVEPAPQSLAELSARYAATIETAIRAWAEDNATDDDVRVLDQVLRRELLNNKVSQSPRCAELAAQYRQIEATLTLPRVIAGIADGGPGFEQPVFVRGDCERPGDKAPRRYLEVLSNPNEHFTQGSGRLELAERIASPTNPLTARVLVNRIWHHLFGTGLVRTVDDFGHVGELPSHPELLDYLASRFMEEGWSVKRLIRELVLTRTFQLSNQPSSRVLEIDPQNRLLQHYPARRMEAEGVRDSILAASGRLDHTLFGMSIQPYREKEYADRRLFPGPLDGNGRRSIYIKNNLMEAPKFLAAFNFPGGKVTQGRRDVTNVPAQALALLNDPFVLDQAAMWSQGLVTRTNDTVASRIDSMFLTALGRSPSTAEKSRFEETVRQFAELHQVPMEGVLGSQVLWKEISHVLFNVNEFIYIP